MASSEEYESARAYLMKAGGDGVSLYEHLSEVLLKVIEEQPDDAVALFEHYSAQTKRSTFKAPKRSDGEPHDQEQAATSTAQARKEWSKRTHALFKKPRPEGEEEEEAEEEPEGEPVQDLPSEMDALEWAGVGIGREEGFRLWLSLKRLSGKSGAQGLRFWGKLLGTGSDYYVAEGQLPDEDDPEPEEGKEALEGKDGANKYSYWVCSEVGGEWTRLPHVAASHICAARKLRRFLTGDLEAAVPGHPPFNGREKHLLRATIARITAGTVLAPTGLFEPEEENEYAFNPAEEPAVPEQEELREAGSWVHLLAELNTAGHAKPVVKDEEEEGGGDGDEEPAPVPPLRSLGEDGEGEPDKCWHISPCPVKGADANSLVALRSLTWPGAVTIAFGKRFANVYVGYGTKHADAPYTPQPPRKVQAEYDDGELKEQEDVTTNPEPEGGAGEEEEED